MYLVLCRDADDDKKNTIFVAEYPKSVAQGIHAVGHKEHPKFKLKYKGEEVPALMHGPVLLYDLMLTKFVDPKQDPIFGTRYEVEPDINNNWSGKVPANIYKYGYPENWKWDDVFTKEEQEAINTFMETNKSDSLLGSLEKKTAALVTSEEDVFKAISQFNANATDPKGAPLLPDVSQFLKTFGEISGKNQISETAAPTTKEETFEEVEEVTEGDFEEVETKSDESFFEDAPEEKAEEDTSANPFGESDDKKKDDPFV